MDISQITNKKSLLNAALKMAGRFTEADEQVVGVDLSAGYVRIAQLVRKEEEWTLSLLDEEPVSGSGNTNQLAIGDAHTEALRTLISRNAVSAKNASISVPVSDAIVRVLSVPLMSENEIKSAIEYDSLWQNVTNLNRDLSEYAIFYQVIHRDPSRNMMDLLFVASRKADIEQHAKVVKSAGLEPVVVDVECFAIRNAFDLHRKQDTKGQVDVIVEFGVRENYVLVLDNGAPFITDLFIRDEDKQKLSSASFSGAEREQFFSRLAMQINQIVASHEEKYKSIPIRTVYVVSDLKDVSSSIEALGKALYNRNIIFFDPLSNPENMIVGRHAVLNSNKNRAAFSVVLGLATRSLDVFGYFKYVVGVKNVNLLPNRENIKRKKKGDIVLRMMALASVSLFVLIFLASFASLYFERDGLRQATRSYPSVEREVNEKREALSALMAERKKIKEMIALGGGIESNQGQLWEILRDLGSYLPDGAWVHSMEYKEGTGLFVTGFARSDQDVLLVVNRLSLNGQIESAELDAVELKTTDLGTRKAELKAFRIKAEVSKRYSVPSPIEEGGDK
jgi:type IV pilus assembly protein PilN